VTLSLPEKITRLKQTPFEKEECDYGELDVDVGKFFKKMTNIVTKRSLMSRKRILNKLANEL
jgi:hypothetical protein